MNPYIELLHFRIDDPVVVVREALSGLREDVEQVGWKFALSFPEMLFSGSLLVVLEGILKAEKN